MAPLGQGWNYLDILNNPGTSTGSSSVTTCSKGPTTPYVSDFTTLVPARAIQFVFATAIPTSQCTAMELGLVGYPVILPDPTTPLSGFSSTVACPINFAVFGPRDASQIPTSSSSAVLTTSPSSTPSGGGLPTLSLSTQVTTVITAIYPSIGTALGGTLVSHTWYNFVSSSSGTPTTSGASVALNGHALHPHLPSSSRSPVQHRGEGCLHPLTVAFTLLLPPPNHPAPQ